MKRTTLSVVILSVNQRSVTRRCLHSLEPLATAGVDAPLQLEVILVDNGSSDGTVTLVDEMPFPVKYIGLGNNRGVAYGRNRGIRAATGQVVMILDNDTEVNAPAVTAMVEWLQAHPDTGVVGPRLVGRQGYTERSFGPFPTPRSRVRSLLGMSRGQLRQVPRDPQEPCYVSGTCQMIPRAVLDRVGELDQSIFFGPEDIDYCVRVRQAGYRVVYLPQAAILHDSRPARLFTRLNHHRLRGYLRLWRKHRHRSK